MSIVRENLMSVPQYCGWTSQFDAEFISEYRKKWGK